MSVLQVPVASGEHIQGDPLAPVTLVEYGDYQCPACGLAFPVVKAVQRHFDKRLGFVFRNFPLTKIHSEAETAAETAEFAAGQGRFWEMHDGLYESQTALGVPLYLELAEELKLAKRALLEALENRSFRPNVRRDYLGGLKSGVNGTPTFFINGRRHDGLFDVGDLAKAIGAELTHVKTPH
jgi:protein-disulfide isomerase